mgnify:CR=1 FL=1
MKKNLILTGMMGVGKSSIGKDLSSKLNMGFKDIDTIIEKKLSLSITEIFKKKGEKFFRIEDIPFKYLLEYAKMLMKSQELTQEWIDNQFQLS